MSEQPNILFNPKLLMSPEEWERIKDLGGPAAKFRTGFSIEINPGRGRYIWYIRNKPLFYMLDAKQVSIPSLLAENIKNFLAAEYNCWIFGPRLIPEGSIAIASYKQLKKKVDHRPDNIMTNVSELYFLDPGITVKPLNGIVRLKEEKVIIAEDQDVTVQLNNYLDGLLKKENKSRHSQVLRQEIAEMDKEVFK